VKFLDGFHPESKFFGNHHGHATCSSSSRRRPGLIGGQTTTRMTGARGVNGLNGRSSEGTGEAGGEASAADGALSKAAAEVEGEKHADKEGENQTELSSVEAASTAVLAAGRVEDGFVVGEGGGRPGRVYVRAKSWGRMGGIDVCVDGGAASARGEAGTGAAMEGGTGVSCAPARRIAKVYRAMSCWAKGCCKRPTFGSVEDMRARR
jgi:hypothetical protein